MFKGLDSFNESHDVSQPSALMYPEKTDEALELWECVVGRVEWCMSGEGKEDLLVGLSWSAWLAVGYQCPACAWAMPCFA